MAGVLPQAEKGPPGAVAISTKYPFSDEELSVHITKMLPFAETLVSGVFGALKATLKVKFTVFDTVEPLPFVAWIWITAVFHPMSPLKPVESVPVPAFAPRE